MKKILCMLLACVLCVSALGGCQMGYPEWVIEDFYGYDEDGNLDKEYLEEKEANEDSSFYLKTYIDREKLYTYRGLKPGDSVDVLIEKYPVDDFLCYYSSKLDEKKQEAYENEPKKAMKEETEDITIWLEYCVFVDKDGKLHPCSSRSSRERENMVRNNTDIEMMCVLSFCVEERQVQVIALDHQARDIILR